MSKVRVKPCPLCGGAVEMDTVERNGKNALIIGHECSTGAKVMFFGKSPAQLIRLWNKRV